MKSEIEQILQKNNITLYRLLKNIGVDPLTAQTLWKRKIRGEVSISKEEFEKLKKAIKEITGSDEVSHCTRTTNKIFLV